LELDARAVGEIRERIPEAIYESRNRTLALRVPDEPAERLAAVVELVQTLADATREEATSPTAA
jgi:hypothetical protein